MEREKSPQEIVEILHKAQLPVYRKIFKNLAPFSLFCHPRMTGKSYNLTLGVMALALQKCVNVCFSRLWQESLQDSLWREVIHKIELLGLEQYFKVTRSCILFKPTGVIFFFRALANYESFKGLQGVSLLYIDEVQQLSQETMQLVIPSIRGEHKHIILSGNLPSSGQSHWLYQAFYTDPLPTYRAYEVKQKDNTFAFASLKDLQTWRKEQQAFFRGRESDYQREILGIWPKNSPCKLFPYLSKRNLSSYSPHFWLYSYKQGQSLWLAVACQDEQVFLLQESTLTIPLTFRRSSPIWISDTQKFVIQVLKSYGFQVRAKKEKSLEELAYYFSQRSLVLDSSLSLLEKELSYLSWQESAQDSVGKMGLLCRALALLEIGLTPAKGTNVKRLHKLS